MTTIFRGLENTLPGERVLTVAPQLAPYVEEAAWRKRTHFYSGRSVSGEALTVEQRVRGGRLALGGQFIVGGVVTGLELGFETVGADPILEVSPGLGLTAAGEDVRLTRPLRVNLAPVPVSTSTGAPTFAALRAATPGPLAIVVLLEPIVTRHVGRQDPRDPCEVDPNDLAFEDEQIVDGARLRLFEFTSLFGALGAPAPSAALLRNALAQVVYNWEIASEHRGFLPWEGTGVGLGLLAFPGGAAAPFVDIHAIARDGGQATRRRKLLNAPGTRRLWQARFLQFGSHLEDLDVASLRTNGLSSAFRFLPPVGVMPAGMIDVRGDRGEPHLPLPPSPVFPASYVLESVPVELESLDDYMQASANLSSFDLTVPDQIQILVPVPGQHFDPDLLLVEDETPDEFRAAVEMFLLRLNYRLGRRSKVRNASLVTGKFLYGSEPVYEPVDAGAVAGEFSDNFPVDSEPREEDYTMGLDGPSGRLQALGVKMATVAETRGLAEFHNQMLSDAGQSPDPMDLLGTPDAVATRMRVRNFGSNGLIDFIAELARRLLGAAEVLDVDFTRIRSELYRIRARIAGESAATQIATSPALAALAPQLSGQATAVQLETFRRNLLKLNDDGTAIVGATAKPTRVVSQILSPSEGQSGTDGVPAALLFGSNIIERLKASAVADAKESAARAKQAIFRHLINIHRSGLSLSRLSFPGFRALKDVAVNPAVDPWNPNTPPAVTDPNLVYKLVPIEWVIFFLEKDFDKNNTWLHDPLVTVGSGPAEPEDEAGLFATAIRSIEQTVAGMRLAEGRLAGFEKALAIAREQVTKELQPWFRMQARLKVLEDEINDLRQDVRVTRVLELEEIARAKRVNASRRRVLAEQVPFLVFRRPRTIDGLRAAPTQPVEPALRPDPVPAALASDFEAPEQIRVMVDLLRDVPLRWLSSGGDELAKLNRRASLWELASTSLYRASRPLPRIYNPFETPYFKDETGERIKRLFYGQRALVDSLREPRLRYEIEWYFRFTWWGLQRPLLDLVTLNDLVLALHGRQDVAQAACKELTNIYRVCACLYDRLGRAPASVRVQWLPFLTETTAHVGLRTLSTLPGWERVEESDRRELQLLVDWLYQALNTADAQVKSFVDDLLRVVFLLAGHPPIRQAITARPTTITPVGIGGRVDLIVDSALARVGMHALLYESPDVAEPSGLAIVQDLGDDLASVRVVNTVQGRAITPQRATLMEPDQTARTTLATGATQSFQPVLEAE